MHRLLLMIVWFPAVLATLIISLIYLHIHYSASAYQAPVQRIAAADSHDATYNKFLDKIPQVLGLSTTSLSAQDARPALVAQFLKKYNSPLIPYAQLLVDKADKYGLDYALIPAMAMQESNLCQKIPDNSHNCWGFGIYGNKVMKFNSYEEAIEAVAKTLKEKYIEDSLTNPDLIMSRWTPSSNGSWSFAVNTFMQDIKQGR